MQESRSFCHLCKMCFQRGICASFAYSKNDIYKKIYMKNYLPQTCHVCKRKKDLLAALANVGK